MACVGAVALIATVSTTTASTESAVWILDLPGGSDIGTSYPCGPVTGAGSQPVDLDSQ
jgi:hypothetical protein